MPGLLLANAPGFRPGADRFRTMEARDAVRRMPLPLDNTFKKAIDQLVFDLKTGTITGTDIFTKLDVIDLFAGFDSGAALVNLRQDRFNPTLSGTVTFAKGMGLTGDGTASYIDSGFNPTTAGGNYTQNSACFGFWSRTSGQRTASIAGYYDGTDGTTINPRNASDVISGRINSAASYSISGITDASGFTMMNRNGSSMSGGTIYKNGSSTGSTGGGTSQAMNNFNFRFGSSSGTAFDASQFAVGIIGGSLTANEHIDLYNAVAAYVAAVTPLS